jgi:rhamnulokinase
MDLGASSARLFAGRLDGDRLEMREAARVANGPVRLPDGLHWDLLHVYQVMLEALAEFSRQAGGEPLSVGIDSWGNDYGLLQADGHLLGLPFHYRDERTTGRLEQADSLVGLERIYEATGIQVMEFNTLFQLLAERELASYAVASDLLLIPDLFGYMLTGERRLERTNASTTQLVDVRTGRLVDWMLSLLGLRSELFAPPIEVGEVLGPLLAGVARSVEIRSPVSVVAVGSHDTASAVLGVPALTDDFAYVVSGTWSLVGLELEAPVIDEASRQANFSNELGVDGTVRFLRNAMGHFMLQECERSWARAGKPGRVGALLEQAACCPPFRSLVDTSSPEFARPGNMPERVRSACAKTGEPVPENDAELVRCVVDSMAIAIAATLEDAQRCAGRHVGVVHLVGGGAANDLLIALVAATSGLEVVAGPVEASAIGNLLVQLRAAGRVGDRAEMRTLVSRSFPTARAAPDPALGRAAASARERLAALSNGGRSVLGPSPAVPEPSVGAGHSVASENGSIRDRPSRGRLTASERPGGRNAP